MEESLGTIGKGGKKVCLTFLTFFGGKGLLVFS